MSIVLDEPRRSATTASPVVDRVSLEVANGELFVLLGASGSGKSTILRMIAGLVPLGRGTVDLDGPGRDRRSRRSSADVGFVFQNYSIFRHMTVAENIEFGLRIREVAADERRASAATSCSSSSASAASATATPSQLSGGQQQRVALARALAYEPERAAPRRALRGARREDPGAAAREPEGDPADARGHDDSRDARPGGGVRARRPHRGHRPRAASRSGQARRALREPALPLRRDVSGRGHDSGRPLPQPPRGARGPVASDSRGGHARRRGPRPRPDPAGAGDAVPDRAGGEASTLGQGEVTVQTFRRRHAPGAGRAAVAGRAPGRAGTPLRRGEPDARGRGAGARSAPAAAPLGRP